MISIPNIYPLAFDTSASTSSKSKKCKSKFPTSDYKYLSNREFILEWERMITPWYECLGPE
jgi:hypothetical protein